MIKDSGRRVCGSKHSSCFACNSLFYGCLGRLWQFFKVVFENKCYCESVLLLLFKENNILSEDLFNSSCNSVLRNFLCSDIQTDGYLSKLHQYCLTQAINHMADTVPTENCSSNFDPTTKHIIFPHYNILPSLDNNN